MLRHQESTREGGLAQGPALALICLSPVKSCRVEGLVRHVCNHEAFFLECVYYTGSRAVRGEMLRQDGCGSQPHLDLAATWRA